MRRHARCPRDHCLEWWASCWRWRWRRQGLAGSKVNSAWPILKCHRQFSIYLASIRVPWKLAGRRLRGCHSRRLDKPRVRVVLLAPGWPRPSPVELLWTNAAVHPIPSRLANGYEKLEWLALSRITRVSCVCPPLGIHTHPLAISKANPSDQ